MKTLSIPDLLDMSWRVDLALFTTYGFDALFFEECLLRCKLLTNARRIAILADERELQKISQSMKRPPRFLNQRYLVLPMRVPGRGVFHPKLGLLIGEKKALLLCGSANLTQAGCTSNLELIHAVECELPEDESETQLPNNLLLLQQALDFFAKALPLAPAAMRGLVASWLEEQRELTPWIDEAVEGNDDELKLLHTLTGTLWSQMLTWLGSAPADELAVLSPFYDHDLTLLKRARSLWPKCQIRVIAQQQTSLLPTKHLTKMTSVKLHELKGAPTRRLHAKLCHIRSGKRGLILAGSANFTAAAFDGHNVETVFAWDCPVDEFDGVFKQPLALKNISSEDFESGDESAPEDCVADSLIHSLVIRSAVLDASGALWIEHDHAAARLSDWKVDIFSPSRRSLDQEGDADLIASPRLAIAPDGRLMAQITEHMLKGQTSALQVRLRTDAATGPCAWLVNEVALTQDAGGESEAQTRERLVQESGRGLVEYLDELGATQGEASVIEYLQRINIRFQENSESTRSKGRRFVVRPFDPFRSDTPPAWLEPILVDPCSHERLREAVLGFVDRHIRENIRRHARRGRLQGVRNMLDVIRACVRFLYIYCERGVINRHYVVERCSRILQLMGNGIENDREAEYGFIEVMLESFEGDRSLATQLLADQLFFATAHATLLVARRLRQELHRSEKGAPHRLDSICQPMLSAFRQLKVRPPDADTLHKALLELELLSEEDALLWAVNA